MVSEITRGRVAQLDLHKSPSTNSAAMPWQFRGSAVETRPTRGAPKADLRPGSTIAQRGVGSSGRTGIFELRALYGRTRPQEALEST